MKSNSTLCTVHADDVGVEVLFLGILCCLSCVSSVKSITGAVVDDFFCRFFAGADVAAFLPIETEQPPAAASHSVSSNDPRGHHAPGGPRITKRVDRFVSNLV